MWCSSAKRARDALNRVVTHTPSDQQHAHTRARAGIGMRSPRSQREHGPVTLRPDRCHVPDAVRVLRGLPPEPQRGERGGGRAKRRSTTRRTHAHVPHGKERARSAFTARGGHRLHGIALHGTACTASLCTAPLARHRSRGYLDSWSSWSLSSFCCQSERRRFGAFCPPLLAPLLACVRAAVISFSFLERTAFCSVDRLPVAVGWGAA